MLTSTIAWYMFNATKHEVDSPQITQAQHEQYASAALDAELSRWIRKRQRFLCLRARMAAMVMRRAFDCWKQDIALGYLLEFLTARVETDYYIVVSSLCE
jgi:hypothetical protein